MSNGENATNSYFWCHDDSGNVLALILRATYRPKGVEFLTPPGFSQQLAAMYRPQGDIIDSHTHLPVGRNVIGTQEVILVQQGKLRLDLYTESTAYVGSVMLGTGDVALLCSGGHGFVAEEDTFFLEVKQGPYSPDKDKERFTPTHNNLMNWIGS